MSDTLFVIEEITDPKESARIRSQIEHANGNSQWLQTHWDELLPQARGRFVAVAGQEAFIADTPEQAWALADAAHPKDDGAMVQYVRLEHGPRFYANQG
jgi:hypothetical protein